jgi:hypothetical protein
MKSMNRKEGKKIAVMMAVVMGFMVIAFLPMADATVTSFTVTPGTGLAGAVDSYTALVTTDGVTTINITIPAGFIAVTPATGGVEIARVDFWNSSTKAYYGYATITSNNANPTTKVDVYCKLRVGGDEVEKGTLNQDIDYTAGAINVFVSGFDCDHSAAILKLPTEEDDGCINISINCTDCPGFSENWRLDDVGIDIGQFVRNPLTADEYTFTADGMDENVTITAPGGCGIIFDSGRWFVDTNGDHVADEDFWFGFDGATPLVGDFGSEDTAIVYAYGGNYRWFVDTTGDHEADKEFWFGPEGSTPLVGDIDQDGTSDIAVIIAYGGNYRWFVDTTGNHEADKEFWFGSAGAIPLVGDIDQDGTDDIAVVYAYGGNYKWYVDTNFDAIADKEFWFGFEGSTPLVGDIDRDGTDDIAVVYAYGGNYRWFVDTNFDLTADQMFWYGFEASTPLAGNIG